MINIWLSVRMYSEKTRPSCGHRSTSLWPPPRQSHFTTCSTSVTHTHTKRHTHTHTYVDAPRHFSLPTLTHTECPSSPCSEMNEFATVLNHFNHFNGKRLIHGLSFCTASQLSHVYTFLHHPHHTLTQTHTNTMTVTP